MTSALRTRCTVLLVAVALAVPGALAATQAPAAAAGTRYVDVVFPNVDVQTDVVYGHAVNVGGTLQALTLDIYRPHGDTATNRPVVFWTHGGGFTSGDKAGMAAWNTALAQRGYVAVSINYRLRPGSYFDFGNQGDPGGQAAVRDATEDGQAAVRWVRANAAALGADPDRIAMGGNSAGAVLSLGVGLLSPQTGAGGTPGVSSRICLALPNAGAMATQVVDPRDAPAVFFHGAQDTRVPIQYAQATAAAMTANGVPNQFFTYPDAGHVVPLATMLPDLVPVLVDRLVNAACPDQTYAPGGGFHPVAPVRVVDTRAGLGGPATPFGPGEQRAIAVTGGATGIPTSGVKAVVLNVTGVAPSADTHLTVWPATFTPPVASNLNVAAGATVAGHVTVGLGLGGAVGVRNNAGTTHVVVDVVGWFDDTGAGARLVAANPTRVLDTRNGTGLVGPFTAGQTRTLPVAGTAGVPAGATAVVLNTTLVAPSAATHLTVWPAGGARPTASALNAAGGATVANLVTVGLGAGGSVSLVNNAGTADVVADVVGWYQPGPGGGVFTPVNPTRLVDTRIGIGGAATALGPGESRTYEPLGLGGVPPIGVTAVVLTVTAVQPSADTHLTVWPAGPAAPTASNLNARRGATVANQVVVGIGAGGSFSLRNNAGTTPVVVDVVGWYA